MPALRPHSARCDVHDARRGVRAARCQQRCSGGRRHGCSASLRGSRRRPEHAFLTLALAQQVARALRHRDGQLRQRREGRRHRRRVREWADQPRRAPDARLWSADWVAAARRRCWRSRSRCKCWGATIAHPHWRQQHCAQPGAHGQQHQWASHHHYRRCSWHWARCRRRRYRYRCRRCSRRRWDRVWVRETAKPCFQSSPWRRCRRLRRQSRRCTSQQRQQPAKRRPPPQRDAARRGRGRRGGQRRLGRRRAL